MYRVFRKKCIFSQFTATPPSPSSLKETFNASVQSLLLAGNFCTTNRSRVLAREMWQTFEKKTQYLMNTLYDALDSPCSLGQPTNNS